MKKQNNKEFEISKLRSLIYIFCREWLLCKNYDRKLEIKARWNQKMQKE